MPAGLDTGFFFALQDRHPVAVRVWREEKSATSVIVLYELNKLFLRGEFKEKDFKYTLEDFTPE